MKILKAWLWRNGPVLVPCLLAVVAIAAWHAATTTALERQVVKLEKTNADLFDKVEALSASVSRAQTSFEQCQSAALTAAQQRTEREARLTQAITGAERTARAISQLRLPQPPMAATGCRDVTALTDRALENAAIAAEIWGVP